MKQLTVLHRMSPLQAVVLILLLLLTLILLFFLSSLRKEFLPGDT